MWTRKPKISTAYHWNIKAPFLRGMKKYNSMMPGQFGLVILLLYWHGVESSCEVVLMSLVHVKMDGTKTPILIIQEASWWNLRETKSSSYKGEIYIRKVIDLKKEPIRIWTITKTLVTKYLLINGFAITFFYFLLYYFYFILFYFRFLFLVADAQAVVGALDANRALARVITICSCVSFRKFWGYFKVEFFFVFEVKVGRL